MAEIEYNTVAACKFEEAAAGGGTKIRTGDFAGDEAPWQQLLPSSSAAAEDSGASSGDTAVLDCVSSPSQARIRLAPMDRIGSRRRGGASESSSPRWRDDVHFHPLLKVPATTATTTAATTTTEDGLVVLFEAVAREGVAVALSPKAGFSSGRTYEVCFGVRGNTRTTIRRHCPRARGGEDGSGEQEEGGGDAPPLSTTLMVSRPGRACHEKSWTSYWVCYSQGKVYAGTGPTPGCQTIAILDDLARQVTPPVLEEDMVRYVGLGNAGVTDRQAATPLKVRKVCVCAVPEQLQSHLLTLKMDELSMPMDAEAEGGEGAADGDDEETRALLREYQEECRKAQARAAKFGVPYQEPPPDAFLPWSQARRLRANPTAGFVTGIDTLSAEEKAKQESRRKRFGVVEQQPAEGAGGEGAEGDTAEKMDDLPVVQAWDNEKLVRGQRVDPPRTLWTVPPPEDAAAPAADPFAMEEEPPTLVPEKIHVFGIDWAAFKQIRNNDIMRYFSMYGPSYVEWLGDLGCNVLFEDRFSAARALDNLSQELPSPPPVPELPTTAAAAEATTTIPEGEEDEQVKEEDNEQPSDEQKKQQESLPDFGAMGWRFGKTPLRKIANDKHGRLGTTARVLMRLATSQDILAKRPSSWPKPPPGFTTKRVLGPGSDFPSQNDRHRMQGEGGRNNESKRRRSSSDNNNNPNPRWDPASGEEPPLLSGGLRSGRSGFSVEAMEAERAKKRAKAAASEPSTTDQS